MPVNNRDFVKMRAMLGGSTGGGGGGSTGGDKWIGDGNTHIWISLPEGRTSPMLGVCPKGTVTVDWGDGTAPDVLTGTSVTSTKWTPKHEYAKSGDYVITLTADGEIGFSGESGVGNGAHILRNSSGQDNANYAYRAAIQKIEIGDNVTSIGSYAFIYCGSLASIVIPENVTSIGRDSFSNCESLKSIVIPEGITKIDTSTFNTSRSLASVVIPESVTVIGSSAFYGCNYLPSIAIPEGVTTIESMAFYDCRSLTSIAIPKGVKKIENVTFQYCYSMKYYDFTNHAAVPTLASTGAFGGIPADCEIRVPAALYDEWIVATNWTTYASNIVAV